MNSKLDIIEKDKLYMYYIENDLSWSQIAKIIGCTRRKVRYYCEKYGFKKSIIKNIDKFELLKYYVDENNTLINTAKHFNCSIKTICTYCNKYGIDKRPDVSINENDLIEIYINQDRSISEVADFFKCSTPTILKFCKIHNIKKEIIKYNITKEQLIELYIVRNMTLYECGEYFGISPNIIYNLCDKYGIKKDNDKRFDNILKTRLKNHTINSSKPEKDFYNYLISKYGNENVKTQYKNDQYPFPCDFYICSIDTYVELNLYWGHGPKPFDKQDAVCLDILDKWINKSQNSHAYKSAIETWIIRDPLKIKTAKDNNLKYIMYYKNDNLYDGRV